MSKLLIIADDFTGSLDTGVQFAKRGIDTLVTLMRENRADISAKCQVLVVDTESRHLSPEKAYERVASLVVGALDNGFEYIYKKTDSTLRGNIGSELAAVLDHVSGKELVFIPSFPKSKRYTINGNQYVGNTPLAETEFANDPFDPVHHSCVKDIIGEQTKIAVENVYFGQYGTFRKPAKTDKTIFVADGRNDDDLIQLGNELKAGNKLHYLAGCAGFAEMLPDLVGFEMKVPAFEKQKGYTLLVSGSINPIALKQVDYACKKCGYTNNSLSIEQMMYSGQDRSDWEQTLKNNLEEKGKAAIWSATSWNNLEESYLKASKIGVSRKEVPKLVASNIGNTVKKIIDSNKIGSLIVFGGDTLLGIMDKLSCNMLRPVCEITPGIVLADSIDCKYKMNIVTKAGGFGEENVVKEIDAFLCK